MRKPIHDFATFEKLFAGIPSGRGIKKLASYSHRTATTKHPCYIPALGDSSGAGRIRLTSGAKVISFLDYQE